MPVPVMPLAIVAGVGFFAYGFGSKLGDGTSSALKYGVAAVAMFAAAKATKLI